ncbi:fasciclin domain-containing protein [Halomonas sp. M5N1S17]|uniref:fasciclin domain-containing protein n=1 Tax=Halomonas alkalisoli TaxID=2907158 RepID=UPI001F3511BF|nr:fasciclin domain-containing protein [Halomonas alkalisoli]MCE9663547.1 fasciclin domain-containing protein [Halomonas alkalisoli]
MNAFTVTAPKWIGASLLGLALATSAHAGSHDHAHDDIVDTAIGAGQFETLVAAVQAAELVEVLKGEGPFTVFAPTDEAFAALPEGTVDTLLLPENQAQLQAILTYHVVPGNVMAAEAMELDSATTVQGQDITITTMDGSVMINDATVVQADIEASNGVIHVIDGVLMPE